MRTPEFRPTRRGLIGLGAAALLTSSGVVPAAAAGRWPSASGGQATLLTWFDATAEAVTAAGAATQVSNNRTWAISWLAAARAIRRVPGGVDHAAYQESALSAAVHHALVALTPGRTEQLTAVLDRTLAGIPAGSSREWGITEGRRQARLVLDARQGDGLDPASVNAPYPVKDPAPGVWQPTPPDHAPATQYGNRLATPFLLGSASRFRLAPPPALGSPLYAAHLAEVRAYGAVDSTARGAYQTETANFWFGSSFTLFTEPLRVALSRSERPLAELVTAVALFHIASADTQIATSDSKYAYERWRPVTAIRTGAIDPDPDWTPLHVTPAHPDYPSGHGTYAGAAEAVLTAYFGPRTAPFALTSPTAPGVTRTYTAWRELTDDNIDARIFSGIHTRSADEAGVELGRTVARHALKHSEELFGAL